MHALHTLMGVTVLELTMHSRALMSGYKILLLLDDHSQSSNDIDQGERRISCMTSGTKQCNALIMNSSRQVKSKVRFQALSACSYNDTE